MFTVSLFLGLPIDSALDAALNALDPDIKKIFIGNEVESYLCEIDYKGVRYLGKYTDEITENNSLILLETNIYSILKKILPTYHSEERSLVLLPAVMTSV